MKTLRETIEFMLKSDDAIVKQSLESPNHIIAVGIAEDDMGIMFSLTANGDHVILLNLCIAAHDRVLASLETETANTPKSELN